MCDPVSLAITSIALTAAGTAVQMQGAEKAKKAQDAANTAELVRQKGYRDQSFGEFDKSLNYNQGQAQQDREKQSASDLNAQFQNAADSVFSGASANGANPNSGVSDAPKAIGDVYKKSMDEARGSIQNMLTAKAALGGFNRMLGNTSIQNQNIANEQQPIAGFMRGSAGVLPLELQKASHAGDSMNSLGTLISLAGMASGMAGTGMALKAATAPALSSQAGIAASGAVPIGQSGINGLVPGVSGASQGGGLFGFLGGSSAANNARMNMLLAGQ